MTQDAIPASDFILLHGYLRKLKRILTQDTYLPLERRIWTDSAVRNGLLSVLRVEKETGNLYNEF